MISAQFRIQLPDEMWISDVSRRFPRATFRLLSGYRLGEKAIELGETITDRPDDVVETTREHPSITNYELLESHDRRVLGKYETTDTDLYEFVEASSLTIEFPVDVQSGWYEFDLTGTRDELTRIQTVLDGSPLSYELRSLTDTRAAGELLTERQREVLDEAIRNGYFEVPRECTLEELATAIDADKSTVSTVLRRGEHRIIKWFVTGPPGNAKERLHERDDFGER